MNAGQWHESVQQELSLLTYGIKQHLSSNLVGIYLHGSLAMGGFNPASSDLDLLVVTCERLSPQARHSLLGLLLLNSGNPYPVEISFLRQSYLLPWQYPTPFDLHYSDALRSELSQIYVAGPNNPLPVQPKSDRDLAAHVMVTRERGIALEGKPIGEVFPVVPRENYLDSILRDLRWARERIGASASTIYAVLNSCRVWIYLADGQVCSKEAGARAALERLPDQYRAIVQNALDIYRSQVTGAAAPDPGAAERLVDFVMGQAAKATPTAPIDPLT